MFRRNETKTRAELLRSELGESWDHALRAAGHAAGGVRATVGPKLGPAAGQVRSAAASGWGSARAALRPAGEAAHQPVKGAGPDRPSKRRWPAMIGLLGGGAVVGAAIAFGLRQRRERQWEDYQQTEPLAEPGVVAGVGDTGGATSVAGRGTGTAAGPAVPRPEPRPEPLA